MRKNVLSVYVDQIYLIVAGLIFVPFFIKHLGIASYGLFGLFSVAQALFQLLDAGLAPTLTRQAARYIAGVNTAEDFKLEFKVAEAAFCVVAALGTIGLSAWTLLGDRPWVSSPDISLSVTRICLVFLFITVAARFVGSLYKGVLRGFESHLWIGGVGIASTTCRFILAIPLIMNSGGNPVPFFALQAVVSVVELLVCRWQVHKHLPSVITDRRRIPVIARSLWRFSGSISLLSLIWIFLVTADRLILSRVLTLTDYGIFTVGLTMTSIVSMLTSPFGTVAGPLLTKLISKADDEAALTLYRKLTQYLALGASAIAAVLTFFTTEIVWVWIGDRNIGAKVSQIVAFYSLGYALVAVSSCAYLLQFARGRLHIHVVGALIQAALLPVAVYVGALKYGMLGAAVAWCAIQVIYFLFWIPVIHSDISKRFHAKWLIRDILPRLMIPYLWCGLIYNVAIPVDSRWGQMVIVALIFASLAVPAWVMNPELRGLFSIRSRIVPRA